MLGVRPLRDELKLPVPDPLLVFDVKEMVGFVLVDHTTPLAVTGEPPSDVTFPSNDAVVGVIELADTVLTKGKATAVFVVKVDSSLYPIPELLIAYAL